MYKIEIKIRFSLQLDMDNVSQRRRRFRHGLNTKKAACAAFFTLITYYCAVLLPAIRL